MPDFILYGLGGLIFYQAYATIRIVRHKPYAAEKKKQQLLVIWLVPFVGAAVALAGLATDPQTSDDASPKKRNRP